MARTTPGQNPRSHWRHLRRWAGDATSAAAGGPSAAMPTATVRQRRVAASDDRSGTPPNFELHGGGLLRPQSSILALRGAKAPWRP